MNHTIRRTKTEDLPGILELIHEFHDESLEGYGIFCNDTVAKALMPKLVESSLVMEIEGKIVGVIAGVFTTHVVDNKPIFQEVIWFVLKEHRRYGLKLLKEMEQFAKDNGAEYMIMVNLGNDKDSQFKKLYESKGYRLLETQYIKGL